MLKITTWKFNLNSKILHTHKNAYITSGKIFRLGKHTAFCIYPSVTRNWQGIAKGCFQKIQKGLI